VKMPDDLRQELRQYASATSLEEFARRIITVIADVVGPLDSDRTDEEHKKFNLAADLIEAWEEVLEGPGSYD
jgi:hypothetical protein